MRAQDVRTLADPTSLSGSVIRVNPANGNPAPGNPLFGNASADTNAKRMVAHGFRNPFRLAIRPDTDDLYVGDVGESTFEEINRVGGEPHPAEQLGLALLRGPESLPQHPRTTYRCATRWSTPP